MAQLKNSLVAQKGVVTRLINLTKSAIEDDAICLIDLEDRISRIKQKHQAVLDYWDFIDVKIEEGTEVKDVESMTTGMFQYEQDKLCRHAHKLAKALTPHPNTKDYH